MLLLLTALWPYYLASSQLFSGKFSTGKDSQVHYNIFELVCLVRLLKYLLFYLFFSNLFVSLM